MKWTKQPLSQSQKKLAVCALDARLEGQNIVNASYGGRMISLGNDNYEEGFFKEEYLWGLLEEHDIECAGEYDTPKEVEGDYYEVQVATNYDFNKANRLINVALRSIEPAFMNVSKWEHTERKDNPKRGILAGPVWRLEFNPNQDYEEILRSLREYGISKTRMVMKGQKNLIEVEPEDEERLTNILREHCFSPDDLDEILKKEILKKENWQSKKRSLDQKNVMRIVVRSGETQAEQIKLFLADHGIEAHAKIGFQIKQNSAISYVEVQPSSVDAFTTLIQSNSSSNSVPQFEFDL